MDADEGDNHRMNNAAMQILSQPYSAHSVWLEQETMKLTLLCALALFVSVKAQPEEILGVEILEVQVFKEGIDNGDCKCTTYVSCQMFLTCIRRRLVRCAYQG